MWLRARPSSLAFVVVTIAVAGCTSADTARGGADEGAAPTDGASAGLDGGAADLAPSPDLAPPADTLTANRDRLLATYVAYLHTTTVPQSNGLDATVASACALWGRLDPSSQAVFLTLTARMQASTVAVDGRSMLSHVARLYRLSGGQGATAGDPGSCGGGEYNRMILSMDAVLHDALVAANTHKGAAPYDVADVVTTAHPFWRDSHDAGGPHAPFDLSDETDDGAPRGQTQYFRDPTSAAATSALGRLDLTALVDPYALEIDQDYDCVHNSNALCSYVTYGPLCAPEASRVGIDLYEADYGATDRTFSPADCASR